MDADDEGCLGFRFQVWDLRMKRILILPAIVLIAWCGLVSWHQATHSQESIATRRALVIGLGEQKDSNWAKINGDKDVAYINEMLMGSGYSDITTLKNDEATKARIVYAFMSLAVRCNAGDIVYVHFSGHGQMVTDVNGDEGRNDRWDEAWIQYDAYLTYCDEDRGEKHLIDDEINVLLTKIKNKIGAEGKLLVVVDACHSGDSSRGDDIEETVRGVYEEFVIPGGQRGRAAKAPEQWLAVSACEDFQLNQEMRNPQVGKLTYALYMLSKNGNVSFGGVEEFMARHRSRMPQNPVQSGDTTNLQLSDFLR